MSAERHAGEQRAPIAADVAPSGRFPKARRLRKRREFLTVQQTGRRIHSRHFVAVVARGAAGPDALGRVGITVSKKVGNAVTRNRIKRLVREFVRSHPVPSGIDAVLIAKPTSASLAGYREAAADLSRLGRGMRAC